MAWVKFKNLSIVTEGLVRIYRRFFFWEEWKPAEEPTFWESNNTVLWEDLKD